MSFSCPHFDPKTDYCERVRDACVCGRPGCVLARNSTFAVPVEVRLRDRAVPPPPQSVQDRHPPVGET